MREKIVGLIGGLGPEATVDLMRRVIRATPARDDGDHIRMLVDNNPKVPSRIKALLEGTGGDPLPVLIDMARRLEAWGADFLAMPCNTAHHYYADIRSSVHVPLLNMIELTVSRVLKDYPGIRTAGILAATTVLKTGLYSKAFGRRGVQVFYPQPEFQNRLMDIIRIIKTGRYGLPEKALLSEITEMAVADKAQALVLACTELSLIGEDLDSNIRIYDASQVLAEEIVRQAKNREPDSI